MKKAILDQKKCDHSPFCPVKRVCPVNAVTQKTGLFSAEFPVVDADKCTGCGKCIRVCPHGAMSLR